ncbi:MAG: hypothetical protein CSA66_01850 [Proteobacteria bacterium]|nr:MAG: hypothetical protein CSA66_01850 [Pseudomonadota bacterium]
MLGDALGGLSDLGVPLQLAVQGRDGLLGGLELRERRVLQRRRGDRRGDDDLSRWGLAFGAVGFDGRACGGGEMAGVRGARARV